MTKQLIPAIPAHPAATRPSDFNRPGTRTGRRRSRMRSGRRPRRPPRAGPTSTWRSSITAPDELVVHLPGRRGHRRTRGSDGSLTRSRQRADRRQQDDVLQARHAERRRERRQEPRTDHAVEHGRVPAGDELARSRGPRPRSPPRSARPTRGATARSRRWRGSRRTRRRRRGRSGRTAPRAPRRPSTSPPRAVRSRRSAPPSDGSPPPATRAPTAAIRAGSPSGARARDHRGFPSSGRGTSDTHATRIGGARRARGRSGASRGSRSRPRARCPARIVAPCGRRCGRWCATAGSRGTRSCRHGATRRAHPHREVVAAQDPPIGGDHRREATTELLGTDLRPARVPPQRVELGVRQPACDARSPPRPSSSRTPTGRRR